MRYRWLIWACLLAIGVSCNRQELVPSYEEQLAHDIAVIDDYLADNGITAVQHPSGLRYVIQTEGPGEKPTSNQCVRVGYVGWLLFETEPFETTASIANPMPKFPLLGWRIGLKEVRKGGKITLYIPSGLAYGTIAQRRGDEVIIPANSNLVFDVELHNITNYNSAGDYCYPWP